MLSALNKLIQKKSTEDLTTGRQLRGPARAFDGAEAPLLTHRYGAMTVLRAYNKYCKKVEIWLLQVAPYMSRKQAALAISGALQREAERTPVAEICKEDDVEFILNAQKVPMEQTAVYKRKYLSEFENMRRYQGESLRSFVNRFRRSQRSLSSVGVEIGHTYDNESLGARLLDKSGLSHDQQRMILVGANKPWFVIAFAVSRLSPTSAFATRR